MSKIFYIMGKSASGKDTIFKMIKEKMPMLQTIVPYTTRPIREGEREGVEYHFVDEKKLQELQAAGKVMELRAYNTVHGIWNYFTVDDGQFDGEKSFVAIGTLESYEKIRDYMGAKKLVPIYVELDDGERLSRALSREREQKEPKYEELCRRFLADAEDFSEEKITRAGICKRFQNWNSADTTEEIILYIQKKL